MHSDDQNRIDVDHNYESIYGKKEIDLTDGSPASQLALLKVNLLLFCRDATSLIGLDAAADSLHNKAKSYFPKDMSQADIGSALGEQFSNAGSDESLAVHQKATESLSIKEMASNALDAITAPFRKHAKIITDEVERLEAEDEKAPKQTTPKPDNNNNNIM